MRSSVFKGACAFFIGIASIFVLGSGGIQTAYRTIDSAGSALTQRTTLNFVNGGCVDNSGAQRTDCTITGGGTALPNYRQTFSSVTSVTLTHNAGTFATLTNCYDNASPANLIIPSGIVLTDANDTTVSFSSSQSGACVVNSSGVSTGGGIVLGTATKTTTYTFTSSDYLIIGDTTGGSFTVNLDASPTTGQIHVIKKKVSANTLTFSGNGNNIDGVASIAITAQYTSYTVQFDGTQWWIE